MNENLWLQKGMTSVNLFKIIGPKNLRTAKIRLMHTGHLLTPMLKNEVGGFEVTDYSQREFNVLTLQITYIRHQCGGIGMFIISE